MSFDRWMDKQDCGNVHSDMFFSDLKKPAIEPQTEALKCVLLAEKSLKEYICWNLHLVWKTSV